MHKIGKKIVFISALFSGIVLNSWAESESNSPHINPRYCYETIRISEEPQQKQKKSLKITDLTTTQLAKAIREGKLSSVRCVKAFLKRIEKNNSGFNGLNAFISVDSVGALEEAARADAMIASAPEKNFPPLFGVPIAVKDNINTKGIRTTGGTPSLQNNIPFFDSLTVERIRNAGAIIVGKTNLHELSFGITNINFAFGPVRNPYNPLMIAGGSSGGCAAAVAARLVPASLGDDTAGSTRIPASLCGVVGFRASTGRYPHSIGVLPTSHTLGTAGLIAKTVSDIDLLDKALTLDYERKKLKTCDQKKIRLGIPQTSFYENLDIETKLIVQEALWVLREAGIELIQTANIPNIHLEECLIAFDTISHFEYFNDLQYYLSTNLTTLTNTDVTNEVMSPDVRLITRSIAENPISVIDYLNILENYLPAIKRSYQQYFAQENLDGILFPTTKLSARPISESIFAVEVNHEQTSTFHAYFQNEAIASLLGVPGLSIPIGLTALGMPVGIELNGLPNQDLDLLSIGLTIQKIFGQIPAPEL
jgi:indoleacetamide hydrolase